MTNPNKNLNRTPYDLGYESGHNDDLPDCPYPDDSEESKEWREGFESGSWNC